ncbi:MAG: SHD1 domain-containing protein, partial [Verrucomicrobiales bacterium]
MKKLATLALTGAFASTLLAGEMRSWTNNQGSKVTAEMIGLQDGKVLIKLETGKTVAFPIENLSPADQEFARANAPVDTL